MARARGHCFSLAKCCHRQCASHAASRPQPQCITRQRLWVRHTSRTKETDRVIWCCCLFHDLIAGICQHHTRGNPSLIKGLHSHHPSQARRGESSLLRLVSMFSLLLQQNRLCLHKGAPKGAWVALLSSPATPKPGRTKKYGISSWGQACFCFLTWASQSQLSSSLTVNICLHYHNYTKHSSQLVCGSMLVCHISKKQSDFYFLSRQILESEQNDKLTNWQKKIERYFLAL